MSRSAQVLLPCWHVLTRAQCVQAVCAAPGSAPHTPPPSLTLRLQQAQVRHQAREERERHPALRGVCSTAAEAAVRLEGLRHALHVRAHFGVRVRACVRVAYIQLCTGSITLAEVLAPGPVPRMNTPPSLPPYPVRVWG